MKVHIFGEGKKLLPLAMILENLFIYSNKITTVITRLRYSSEVSTIAVHKRSSRIVLSRSLAGFPVRESLRAHRNSIHEVVANSKRRGFTESLGPGNIPKN
ncbi:uncharacterized protein LOC114880060 [Osmia bicornis bicornis]|uniref:uncharacterized protein LOC114880060 n=1 Tax=Osmia bicornis bicornis TaxID=1437191 RepID=UPI0010F88A08|nr:uncharacterized protein LOC114880060 [Osmia bicornis bicornis]